MHQGVLASPTWSPDGTRIAFVEYRMTASAPDWTSDIYVIDSNGEHLTRVTGTPRVTEDELDWSSRNGKGRSGRATSCTRPSPTGAGSDRSRTTGVGPSARLGTGREQVDVRPR